MFEMRTNEEYMNTVMDAAFDSFAEKIVSETDFDKPVELTPGEEFGQAFAKMLFGSFIK